MKHTVESFRAEFARITGHAPSWGDWYYHEECRKAGASCSVHQADPPGTENPRYLQVPTDGAAATLHAEDIRGRDRGEMKTYTQITEEYEGFYLWSCDATRQWNEPLVDVLIYETESDMDADTDNSLAIHRETVIDDRG